MTEYFVFVNISFNPRAIFVLLKKWIRKIITFGDKIEDCYQWKGNYGYHIGYKINGKFDNTNQTEKNILYWSSLLHNTEQDGNVYSDDYFILLY